MSDMSEQNTRSDAAPVPGASDAASQAENYEADLASMQDTIFTSRASVIPHMEILSSQLEGAGASGELLASVADLASNALTSVSTIESAVGAVRTVNDDVAQAHQDQPDAVTNKEYYSEP